MPRRPPQHPLPRGLVWRLADADEFRAGDPIAEWAYVTPQEPNSVRTSALQYATSQQQTDTARFWFLSNYEPFANDGDLFGFAGQGLGFGQAPFAPSSYPPDTLLQEEFAGTIPSNILAILATELGLQAGLWIPIPDLPQTMLAIAEGSSADPEATVAAALAKVEANVGQAELIGPGHNQGPPLLDARLREEIIQAVRMTQQGIAAKEAGVSETKEGQNRLHDAMGAVGRGLMKAAADHAGKAIYSVAMTAAIELFHHLNEAPAALSQWLATYPPSPLM